jgi:hypothetical protein
MIGSRINTLMTSQDQPCYVWHHTKRDHAAGDGTVTVNIKPPKTRSYVDGFPTDYHVTVTPSQPCAVGVTNKSRDGFDVTLRSLDGGALPAGTFSVLVIG